jgi:Spy/CpxP family protein refolding chaperone
MSIRIRLLGVALGAALLAPLGAAAQTLPPATAPAPAAAPAAAHRHHGGLRHALRNLNLTDDQRTQIAAIMKQTRAANQSAPDRETKRANNRRMRARINSLLTPDQRTALRTALHRERSTQNQAPPAPQPGT